MGMFCCITSRDGNETIGFTKDFECGEYSEQSNCVFLPVFIIDR
jgi:hypothetical protein